MDDTCPCCGSIDAATTDDRTTETDGGIADRLLSGDAPLESPLPTDLGRALGDLLGEPPVGTIDEWVDLMREHTGGGAISRSDLCRVDEPTPHWGEVNGERYYFACFYDAVVLSGLVDDPVDIHTESPDGTVVEARAVGSEDLSVRPSDAVFSIGCATDVDVPADEDPVHETVYGAVCPYVRAFPSVAEYDRWRETVPAATVATSLDGATELSEALLEENR